MTPASRPRLTADRRHTLRGKRTLDWFFQNRRWLRIESRAVRAAYALRPLSEGDTPIQFLLIASKRDMKRAHDRNKTKRWLRAAIVDTPMLGDIERRMGDLQLLLLLQVSAPPSQMDYEQIRSAVSSVAMTLATKLKI